MSEILFLKIAVEPLLLVLNISTIGKIIPTFGAPKI